MADASVLRRIDDVAPASWLAASGADATRLITLGPAGFEAYARLRYIPDPDGPGQAESDAIVPDDHLNGIEQARRVLLALTASTRTADRCFFCVWDGWVGTALKPDLLRGPLVELPHRKYVLFTGPLSEIRRWEQTFAGGEPCPPPAFVWPADRQWCFTSDVDPHWAGIGATAATIDALIKQPGVDVVAAPPDEPVQAYGS